MDDPSTYGIVGRLALAGFVMIAPTLLFLGLVRGLEALRDDAFILEWTQHHDGAPMNDDVLAVLSDELGVDSRSARRVDVAGICCPTCGVENRRDVRYCRDCLSALPS